RGSFCNIDMFPFGRGKLALIVWKLFAKFSLAVVLAFVTYSLFAEIYFERDYGFCNFEIARRSLF
ncbi:MAG: hypothetical protein RR048_06805, partial [Oscillospiraceae bacterium]